MRTKTMSDVEFCKRCLEIIRRGSQDEEFQSSSPETACISYDADSCSATGLPSQKCQSCKEAVKTRPGHALQLQILRLRVRRTRKSCESERQADAPLRMSS